MECKRISRECKSCSKYMCIFVYVHTHTHKWGKIKMGKLNGRKDANWDTVKVFRKTMGESLRKTYQLILPIMQLSYCSASASTDKRWCCRPSLQGAITFAINYPTVFALADEFVLDCFLWSHCDDAPEFDRMSVTLMCNWNTSLISTWRRNSDINPKHVIDHDTFQLRFGTLVRLLISNIYRNSRVLYVYDTDFSAFPGTLNPLHSLLKYKIIAACSEDFIYFFGGQMRQTRSWLFLISALFLIEYA